MLKEFINGSDHRVVASYLELYEEGEVEHINGVWPVLSDEQLFTARKLNPPGKNKTHNGTTHFSL